MTHSVTRVGKELQKEAEIREIRAHFPNLQRAVSELQEKHNTLASYTQRMVSELQQAFNQLHAKIRGIDYRGPLGWWRRRRDLRELKTMELAARKLAAKMEAEQQRTATRQMQKELARGLCVLFGYEWDAEPKVTIMKAAATRRSV
jgi:cell fate (sporulation/competence/biofilm development) regulator YlbF (YheA/YmcA/DUF963 family)